MKFLLLFYILFLFKSLVFSSDSLKYLSVKPFDIKNIIGGNIIIAPKLLINENNEIRAAKNKFTKVKIFIDEKLIFENDKEPFYTNNDFTFYKNGIHDIKVYAVDDENIEYNFYTNFYVSNVNVYFRLKLNEPLPLNRDIYLTGNISVLKPIGEEWNPKGLKLCRIDDYTFETNFLVGLNENFTYELTLGGWAAKGRNSKNEIVHKSIKITKENLIIEEFIDNWGKIKGEIKNSGYVINFTNILTDIFINYTHPFTNYMQLNYSYDGRKYISLISENT